jgi:hypothetical protein
MTACNLSNQSGTLDCPYGVCKNSCQQFIRTSSVGSWSNQDQIKALKGDLQNLEKILLGFETAADKGPAIHASTKMKSKNTSNFMASHMMTLITSKMKPMPN